MNEKDLELADALAQAQRDNGIANSKRAMAPQRHPNFDGLHCVDCEVEIPAARLAMHRVRCTGCQAYIERTRT